MFPVGGLIKKAKAMIPKAVSATVKTVAKTAVKAVLKNTGSVVNNIQKGANAISKAVAAIPKKINANVQKAQAVTQKVAAAVPKAVNAVKAAGKQQLDEIVKKGNEVKASIQSIANDINQRNQRILDKINQEALDSSFRIIKGSLTIGALSPMHSSKNISIALDFLLKSRKIIIEEYPILNIGTENSKKFISYIENQAKNLNDTIGSAVYNADIPMISDTVGAFTGQRDPNAESNIYSMQGAFYRGIYVKGLGGTIDALANLAADPFEAIEGLNSIALEPEVMIPGIFNMAKEYVNTKIIHGSAEDRSEAAGQVVFEIAQYCIGTGEVKAGTKIAEISTDAAKTSKAINVTNKVNKYIKAEKLLNSTFSKGLRETFSVAAKNAGQNAVDSIDYLRLLFRNGSSNMIPAYARIGAIDDFVGTGEILQKSLSKFKSMASEVTQGKGVNFKPKINNNAIEEGAEKASKVVSEGTGNLKKSLTDKINNIREQMPNNPLKNKGNMAAAEVDIPGIKKEFSAHSKINSSLDKGADISDFSLLKPEGDRIFKTYEPASSTLTGTPFDRFHDTEAKILEDIASQITDPNISGTIDLFTELPACQSCTNIIFEFKRKFPNIKLNILTKD